MDNIKSMTGYGKATISTDLRRITVEFKSLNSKQLDLSAKMPFIYREQEFILRGLAAKTIVRGKADMYISVENIVAKSSTSINKDVFNEYLNQITDLECDLDNSDVLSAVLRLPDVISSPKVEIEKDEIETLYKVVDLALIEFVDFRRNEGGAMIKDILGHLDTIESLSIEVLKYDKERIETVKNRITENLEKLRISLDQSRLEQEMIYYLEKLDITEEKVRLKKHIEYFREVCENEENVGKKLGFVTQEIGREINTLGSKSNHVAMQQLVVNMKDALEKIKEQLLNIL